MAVAYANQDKEQMKATEAFLKSGFITVDIFAVSPVAKQTAGGVSSSAPSARSRASTVGLAARE